MKPKVGDVVGKYTVLEVVEYRVEKKGRTKPTPTWKVRARCECGKEAWLYASNFGRKGLACRQCAAKARVTHGMANTKIYHVWASMIERCTNVSQPCYQYYGGAGVKVCERWRKFENFYEDVGERPGDLQLDRINTYGNYEPGNTRWATRSENLLNRRPRKTQVKRVEAL